VVFFFKPLSFSYTKNWANIHTCACTCN